MRQIANCANCNEPRPIAAHGLCYKCYRRGVRGSSTTLTPYRLVNHAKQLKKTQNKARTALFKMMEALDELTVLLQRSIRLVTLNISADAGTHQKRHTTAHSMRVRRPNATI